MPPITIRPASVVLAALFFFASNSGVHARDGVETAGDIFAYLLPVTAVGMTLGHKDGTGTAQFAESTALAMSLTLALKYSISEDRPNHHDRHSFPSGHSAAVFSSAEFLRMRYGWEYGIPVYIVATAVAFSRVHAKQHHVHDVIAGAGIGIGSSYLLTETYRGWHVQVSISPSSETIWLSHSW